VIIKYDPDLKPLYTLLNIEELNPATAIKRFTVPSLSSVNHKDRYEIMKSLSLKWGSYCSDEELVSMLKDVKFIPVWNQEANGYWECDYNAEPQLARSMYSWQNSDLMFTLKGSDTTK